VQLGGWERRWAACLGLVVVWILVKVEKEDEMWPVIKDKVG
jgi:hypothetical protein